MESIITKKGTYKSVFIIFCLAILSSPLNIKILSAFRIADIFLIISLIIFCFQNPKIKFSNLFFFSIFFSLLVLSSYLSIFHYKILKIEGLFFYYKYSLIFILPWMIVTIVNSSDRLNKIINILYYIFVALIAWVYIYNFFRHIGIISGHPRPSFPFTRFDQPDAHVYSSYLAFTVIAYQEYIKNKLKHGIIKSSLIIISSLIALFLTGSKTGILIICLYFLFIFPRFFLMPTKKDITVIMVTFFTVIALFFYFSQYHFVNKDFEKLLQRTLTYNFSEATINTRYNNFFVALNESLNNYLFFGSGPTSATQRFYDGGISIILVHSGLFGIFLLIIALIYICFRVKLLSKISNTHNFYYTFLVLIFLYSLINIITEHFLITRNFFPIVTLISSLYANIILINSSLSKNY